MSTTGASETSDEERNRLGRRVAVAGVSGSGWPVQPQEPPGPSNPRKPLACPAGRAGMKGAGSLGEPRNRKHRNRAERGEERSVFRGSRARRGLSRRCCRWLRCSGASRGLSRPHETRGFDAQDSNIRKAIDVQTLHTPPSRSDRPPQGGWERVGRGSLQSFRSRHATTASGRTSTVPRSSLPARRPRPLSRRGRASPR